MTDFCVFSGWDRRQAEAAEVFAHSVHRNTSIEVEFGFVSGGPNQPPGTNSFTPTQRMGVTAFTYARFLVPWLCGYGGRALFCDGCDQLCLGDVAELAELDMQGKPLWVVKHPPIRKVPRQDRARSWTSLMLMNCAGFKVWEPEMVEVAPDERLMRLRDFSDDQIGELPPEWNAMCAIPGEPPEGAKIAHWSALSNPDGGSWVDRSGSVIWKGWRERWRAAR